MIEAIKIKLQKRQRLLHKNLSFLLDSSNLDLKSLSLETNVPMATLVRMKKEDNNPTLSTLEPIADFFRIELDDLLYEDISSNEYQTKKKVGGMQYLPYIHLNAIIKWPINFMDDYVVGAVGRFSEGTFGICIDSDSMMPIFSRDSIVIIDPKIKPKDGDYVFCIIERDNKPVLRQYFVDGNTIFIKPINPHFGGIVPVKKIKIIGLVIKSIENYR